MKLSQSFFYPQKNIPKDANSKNARYLIQAGLADKNLSGVYALLPFGLKIYRKIENLLRIKMNSLDAEELLMNVLQNKELWQKTNRWQTANDVFYKIMDQDKEINLAPTHEEQITQIVKEKVFSYKQLPILLYQIQTKFRKEKRAKSGMLRLREFIMKDCYSFSSSLEEHQLIYEKVKQVYFDFFAQLNFQVKLVSASGGIFSQFSHEFQVFCDVGEDTILYCSSCGLAYNKEISPVKEGDKCPQCQGLIENRKGVEVGNIFTLNNKFSQPLEATFLDKNGKQQYFTMGCYGIGLSRCLAVAIELFYQEKKKLMIWPRNIAPFLVEIISINKKQEAEKLYQDLIQQNIEVLLDDRDKSFGQKMSEADLLGCPYKIILSEKTLANSKVEIRDEIKQKVKFVSFDKVVDYLN